MIYFIQNVANGLVKIGYSRNPSLRMANMQTSSPDPLRLLGTMPGDREWERRLHRRYRHRHHRGEWFALIEKEVIEVIECETPLVDRERQRILPFEARESLVFSIDVSQDRLAS